MKINEIKQPKKINENLAGTLFGDRTLASIKGAFTGYGTKHQLAQDIFLRDFYQDALVSLTNGIKSGYINPELAGDQNQAPPASATSSASAPSTMQKMSPSELATAKSQNKIAPGTQTGMAPSPRLTPRERLMLQRQQKAVKENNEYLSLNKIFESIISEMDGGEQTSIAAYMMEWFERYMEGVNWENKRAAAEKYAKQIQDTYKTDGGKAAIKNFGKFAFAISGASGATPAGVKNAVPAQPAATAASSRRKLSPDQLAADLAALNPRERDEVLNKVKAATK